MEQTPAQKNIMKSMHCMGVITQYMTQKKFLNLQLVNSEFYDKVVPKVMNERKQFPNVDPHTHLFIKGKDVFGMKVSQGTDTHLVDFEEDEWLHDYQHEIMDKENNKPEKLFSIDDLNLTADGKTEEVLI